MREFEARPRSLEEVLSMYGLTKEPIEEVPEHLTIRPLARDYKAISKIDVLGIASVVFFEDPEEPEKIRAAWCFNGKESTSKVGNKVDVEAEVAKSIEANLVGEKEKNETFVELYSLVLKHNGSIKEINEFPADLDSTNAFYMKPQDFRADEGRTVLRMDFPKGVTILALPPGGRNFYAGIWVHGKYSGGNGDFSISELEHQIKFSR